MINLKKVFKFFRRAKRAFKSRGYRAIETSQVKSIVETQLNQLGYKWSLQEPKGRVGKGSLLKNIDNNKQFPTHKHILIYTLENAQYTIGGSEVKPRIVIRNSYDKSCSFLIGVGFYRLICTNGLMVGEDYFKDRIIHVHGPKIEQFFKTLPDRIKIACQSIVEVVDKLDQLSQKPITIEKAKEIVNNLDVLADRSKKDLTNKLEYHKQGRQVFRALDKPDNLWSLYNIVNETIRKTSRSEQANFNKNLNLLADIEKLAA